MTTRAERIEQILTHRFVPPRLSIHDESAQHAGHTGASPQGETHFRVEMVSDQFDGMSRLQRSRVVHEALKGEFATGLHALSLALGGPKDAGERPKNSDKSVL